MARGSGAISKISVLRRVVAERKRKFQSPTARGSGAISKISVLRRVVVERKRKFQSPTARGRGARAKFFKVPRAGCCHKYMNKTGRLCTYYKLHVTMHSPVTSDHKHKFKPRGLFFCLFLWLPLFLLFSTYKYHNTPNRGTKDETMTKNDSHNLNGSTMYDLW